MLGANHYLTFASGEDYSVRAGANHQTGLASRVQGGQPPLSGFFMSVIQDTQFMGGSCGELKSSPVLARYANPHESAHPIGVGGAENTNRLARSNTMPKTYFAPSLPAIPKRRHNYKANRGKIIDVIPLPFEHGPRSIKEVGRVPFCSWYVPRIDDYGLACRMGQEYAGHFVQYLKDNPESVPNNRLGNIAKDINFEDDSDAAGYWVGFFTELARYLLIGAANMDVFKELDKSIAEDERRCADDEEDEEP